MGKHLLPGIRFAVTVNCLQRVFNFIGTGVSGGEEGALKGPSIMPGGQKEAYELVAPILEQMRPGQKTANRVSHTLVPMVLVTMLKWFTMASNMVICS